MNLKTKRSKNRRALNKNKDKNNKNIIVMGSNAAGLSSKMESFEHIVNLVKPSIFFLQKTKMRREGKIKLIKLETFKSKSSSETPN